METVKPILITGADRSGSSIVARILSMCGVFGGTVSTMYENKEIKTLHHFLIDNNTQQPYMPKSTVKWLKTLDWAMFVYTTMQTQGLEVDKPFFYKDSGIAQAWQLWNTAFPEAHWLIVRRRTADIVNSCMHTAYMKRFKNTYHQRIVGAKTEQEGWLWWVRQYEEKFLEITTAGTSHEIVWPERMADGDYSQMKDIVKYLGLEWNPLVEETITPLFKNRNENGKESKC